MKSNEKNTGIEKRKLKKRNLIAIIGLLVICLIGAAFLSMYVSKNWLTVSHYTIRSDKLKSEIRVVQLSDLHNFEFGENNEKLIQKVKGESPDLIFMTGDMLNNNVESISVVTTLINNLSQIAPVYLSMGNHEVDYENRYKNNIRDRFEEAGAVVLDAEWNDIEIKGNALRIGGIYGYCLPRKIIQTGEGKQSELDFLTSMEETRAYTMLLAHIPLCWLESGSLDCYDIDSVWAGHAHGGQIVLPFVGGLYAPDQGYFIGRVWGVFDSEDGSKHLILSRGLGTNKKIPRMNNIPEIVSVTITPEK